jgi:biopolymer transport protein ExbD
MNEHSARAKRMERHHKRRESSKLNLVSLMDIFTILVFFLLVNSSDVQELPSTKSVEMPESVSEMKPKETVVVVVSREGVLVQGQPVLSFEDALATEGNMLEPLKAALAAQAGRLISADSEGGREVTIIGDKELPYSILRKVMATCTEADYGRVSLAVMQKSTVAGGVEI